MITVTSRDGVEFAVATARGDWATVQAERAFAATRTASELDSFGDYCRVDPFTGYVVAPEPMPVPRITSPQERRATFTLIKGGKP
jgi:hypothetical protein